MCARVNDQVAVSLELTEDTCHKGGHRCGAEGCEITMLFTSAPPCLSARWAVWMENLSNVSWKHFPEHSYWVFHLS